MCGYDLSGIDAEICPECGVDVCDARRTLDGVQRIVRGIMLSVAVQLLLGCGGAALGASGIGFGRVLGVVGVLVVLSYTEGWIKSMIAQHGIAFRGRWQILVFGAPAVGTIGSVALSLLGAAG